MKKTVISLIGAQVSAENCSRIIQIVDKYMFNTEISTDALPSERTVCCHADQGHFLAKQQVAEAAATHIFDLHADGTSRDKKKFVGMQITTSEGSLSCGFKTVAAENASGLVETTLNLLQELFEVYSEEEQQQHFRRMLSNLSGVMTNRVSVMKKYKQDLNDAIQTTPGATESIQFLYCNAHFLLGPSSAASSSLLVIQQELGEGRIGRDCDQQFRTFSTPEAAAVHYVRMACEVSGPRGDEKNGCRDAWLAYCMIYGHPSTIQSFKANRFNNLFEAAAALHFHRKSIIDFLMNYMPSRNRKRESVLLDARSDQVSVYVLSLAMVFFRVTGPYWQLLGSGAHYLDFHLHVVQTKSQPLEWK